MASEITIRQMVAEDWKSVRTIYLEGLATGDATFESDAPSWEKWDQSHISIPRLVAVSLSEGGAVGWSALAPVSSRAAYRGVVEVSVYVADNFRGKGIGKALLRQLVAQSEQRGFYMLQASVFPENIASLTLHKTCGFRVVGTRQRIGIVQGIWRDTVLLERRSEIVGNE
ncbi:MAG: GNAT family N-acetyltransferase [Pyrinomonadaceae bacterium]|nr:GNAT family N-acetyltransferase [Pyrinomonadaceae bacterium]